MQLSYRNYLAWPSTSKKRNSLFQSMVILPMKLRTVLKLKLTVVSWILLAASLALGQTNQNASLQPTDRPLNMLVLGDSILWGEGLKARHKSWYQIKVWLEKNTGRLVVEKIAAHSGAVVELGFTDDRMTA